MSRGDGNPSVPSNSPSTWLELYRSGLALGLRPNEFWDMTFMEFIAFTASFRDHDRRMWNHTASVLATIANVNRDRKRQPKPFTPSDFNPYESEDQPSRELTKQDIQNIASWRVNPS
ncbi:phage tail assembly chaperone [Flavobacteriales bacterium]|nr:phage tail assembly chaperone [Flavobacteriales bacterium]